MSKFKVGDEVRVINAAGSSHQDGDIGKVVEVIDRDFLNVEVKGKDLQRHWPEDLEKVTKKGVKKGVKKGYKADDKVTLLMGLPAFGPCWVAGAKGKALSTCDDGTTLVKIKGGMRTRWVDNNDIEKRKRKKKVKKYQEGDQVVLTKWGEAYGPSRFKEGEVLTISFVDTDGVMGCFYHFVGELAGLYESAKGEKRRFKKYKPAPVDIEKVLAELNQSYIQIGVISAWLDIICQLVPSESLTELTENRSELITKALELQEQIIKAFNEQA